MSDHGAPVLDDDQWRCLDEALRKLEIAWRDGVEVDLAQLAPSAHGPHRARVLVELVKIDQEHRFRAGRPRLLEAYLQQWPELAGDPELLLELLESECMTRMAVGAVPTADELRARFPAISPGIDLVALAAEVDREGRRADAEATAAGSPMPPSPSERYQIRGILGRGSMGAVYRAFDTHLDREVALKIPNSDLGNDPAIFQRWLYEAKTLARISHRNVCQVFDAGQSHGRYFFAMALIKGKSLAVRLQEGPLDCRTAAELMCKLAKALAVVHAAGIIHRDLKPQNIMLDGEGEPLLTDFGLARPAQARGESTGDSGTPAYMSPEQWRGGPASAASDIYALGVILYQALTGRLPFSGTWSQLSRQAARDRPVPPSAVRPSVDPALEAICLKAMANQPSDRYRSAKAFAEALAAYLRPARKVSRYSRVRSRVPMLVSYIPLRRDLLDRLLKPTVRRLTIAYVAIAALLFTVGVMYFSWPAPASHGVLVLEVLPTDAEVRIDGVCCQIRPPRDAIMLSAGEHRLEVRKRGFDSEDEVFVIRRGRKVELSISLEPKPAK